MKTVKIKVLPTEMQVKCFEQLCEELEWTWNQILANELNNHSAVWYKWARSQNEKIKKRKNAKGKTKTDKETAPVFEHEFSFDGIIECPLRFGRSAFIGASCDIWDYASDSPTNATKYNIAHWQKDESIKIAYKKYTSTTKYTIEYQHGYKLVKGDKWCTPRIVHPYECKTIQMGDRVIEFKRPDDYDRMDRLNFLRRLQGLPDLTPGISSYIGGLVKKNFVPAWDGFTSAKLINRKKPKFKNTFNKLSTITSADLLPKSGFNHEQQIIKIPLLGALKIIDKSYKRKLCNSASQIRTYSLTRDASGFYVCIVLAHPLETELSELKKPGKKKTDEIKERIAELSDAVKKLYQRRQKGLSVGIDPGVKVVVATDHGALFLPNLERDRIEFRIDALKSRLSKLKNTNDAKYKALYGLDPKHRTFTKNESKLQSKISRLSKRALNCTSAFNHKLATRIAKTYTTVCWEDSNIQNLIKKTKPKISATNGGYDRNGASAKTALNHSLKMRSLGDLKAKTKAKVELFGGKFLDPKAHNSSQECSCCGEKGDRINQHTFICTNTSCPEFNIPRNADTNAAKNHKRNAGIPVTQDTSYNIDKLECKKMKKFKNIVKQVILM